jgi:ATP-dependent DNA ligase
MARSLTELRAQATQLQITFTDAHRREDLMDLIRDALGGFDPELQIDPMKAQDLKRKIEWSAQDPFAAIAPKYFNEAYVMEPKLDGARMRLYLGETANTMNTGRRSDKTFAYIQRENNFPHMRDAVNPELAGTILDGEITAPHSQITTASGVTTNSLLNATVALTNCAPELSVATQAREGLVKFHAFDILAYRGRDVTSLPLTERRLLLQEVMRSLWSSIHSTSAWLKLIQQFASNRETIKRALTDGYEGVMVKSLTGAYAAGKRSAAWQKIKTMSTFDAFVTGWDPGEGKNTGKVGALRMSVLDDLGLPVEVAKHGALTDEFRAELTAADGSLKPEWMGTVMELMGQGVTKEGRVRHPHLVRLRPDKGRDECHLDQLLNLPRV